MSAIYVDLDSTGIATPFEFDPEVASTLIQRVEETLDHLAPFFADVAREMAPSLLAVGPIITELMTDRFGHLDPAQGLASLRNLIGGLVALPESDDETDEDRIARVVALLTGAPANDFDEGTS